MYINIISVEDVLDLKNKISKIPKSEISQIFLHFTIAHVEIYKDQNSNFFAKIHHMSQIKIYTITEHNLMLLIDKIVKYVYTHVFNKKHFSKIEQKKLTTEFNFIF